MNALIQAEYDQLTEAQKQKFHELEAWQSNGNPGQGMISDFAYEQILKWVKAMEL